MIAVRVNQLTCLCQSFHIIEESYTVWLPVNVLNTNNTKPFSKLGFLEFPSDATLGDLRDKIKAQFLGTLHDKQFFFQDDTMVNVDPTTEVEIGAKDFYNLSVIIKLASQGWYCYYPISQL